MDDIVTHALNVSISALRHDLATLEIPHRLLPQQPPPELPQQLLELPQPPHELPQQPLRLPPPQFQLTQQSFEMSLAQFELPQRPLELPPPQFELLQPQMQRPLRPLPIQLQKSPVLQLESPILNGTWTNARSVQPKRPPPEELRPRSSRKAKTAAYEKMAHIMKYM